MRDARLLPKLLPLVFALGCGNDFTAPSAIGGLRVLAVQQGNGTIMPGSKVKLSMLLADNRIIGRAEGEPAPELNVVWLAGCNNPPGRQYFACLPVLRELAAGLGDGSAPAGTAGKLGTGTEFEVSIPDDILTTAPLVPHDPIHYGVSYVFFVACAGIPGFDPSITEGIPVTCTAPDGKAVGTSGMVVGFTTLYTYDGAANLNPILTALDFDGEEMPATLVDRPATSCTVDEDCAPKAGQSHKHPRICTLDTRTCAPVLNACSSGDDCPEVRVTPRIDTASVERYTDGYEVIWASYYATSGAMKEDARLVVDRTAGLTGDPTTLWKIPDKRGTSRFWVTVNDQRGGATWGFFDVALE
ncbi:MAG TPA: hypothetical protein VFV94_09165 [Polyangiaceae bacterium]|nr:hypothetical protein [Polyangiaceae bacterium]